MLRSLSEKPLRLPRFFSRSIPKDAARILTFNDERESIVAEVVDRVVSKHSSTAKRIEAALAEAAFHEIKRLEAQRDDEARAHLGAWRSMLRRVPHMTRDEAEDELRRIVLRMTNDIAGNFDPRVYDIAREGIPRLLVGTIRPRALPAALLGGNLDALDRLMTVEGDLDHLRRVEKHATLVYVPTHSSNLDSIVLGYALERVGLSPVMYGAGKNLFTNPFISFFMHNLGAYRVDRRIRTELYKDTLKTYGLVTIHRGYHSLFFPGGTRSRSNLVESRLKLGLAGAGVEAFAERCVSGDRRPVLFVPTTINYALCLEAETLVEEWLKEEGKARYMIDDDEFSQLERLVAFFRKIVRLRAACVIRFGRPVDPYGNLVTDEAESLAPDGRVIDASTYVRMHGVPTLDAARDAAYTRSLSDVLVAAYRRETVVMGTQLVAHVLFRALAQDARGLDTFAMLRLREVSFDAAAIFAEIGKTRDRLLALVEKGEVHASAVVRSDPPEELVRRAFEVWSGYHTRPSARHEGSRIIIEDPTLLLYYQNRLVAFAEDIAGPEHAEAARFISHIGVKR